MVSVPKRAMTIQESYDFGEALATIKGVTYKHMQAMLKGYREKKWDLEHNEGKWAEVATE